MSNPIEFHFGSVKDSLPMWALQWHDPMFVASDGKVVYNINTFPYVSEDKDKRNLEWDIWRQKCQGVAVNDDDP